MQRSPLSSARRSGAMRLLSLLVLSGCAAETPTAPPSELPSFAAAGGSGPTVRAADPDSGFQGTTLDVRVLGSGFDKGSIATWALAGDTVNATTKITTNSTRFVKSGELVANITIAGDALLARFDVVVVTFAGKKGIGIEAFTVKATGNPPARYSALFSDATGDGLRSDNGTSYQDGSPSYDPNCVHSQESAGGLYQLRTIAATGACKAVQRPGWRFFKIDFGGPHTVDLDQDGDTNEAVEDAPARMLAADAFAQGATSTGLRILIFKVNPDGSTEWDTMWELRYRSLVTVSGAGTRVIQASSGSATVDIYTLGRAGKVAQLISTIADLPFRLTLTPMP